jgi:hypothetical protein
MRRCSTLLLLFAVGCAGGASTSQSDGFVPLFDGQTLNGWVRVNCAPETFRVADGMIITSGKPTGVLRSERMYENYVVEFDWMHLQKGGNSGFFIHSGAMPARGQPFTKAHEIQVLDGDDPKGQWTGHGDVFSIHGASFVPDRPHPAGWMRCLPSEKRAHPFGQWNHYKVTCNDGSVKLEVNGKEVSGGTKCNPRKGYLCLESEGAPCHFRNLRIKELPSTNPPADEVAEEDHGFQSLYTGLDLRGWTAGEGWTSKDWVLNFDGKAGHGTIATQKSYRNYAFIFDWRSKDKGNVTVRIGGWQVPVNAREKAGDWSRVTGAVGLASYDVDGNCARLIAPIKPAPFVLEAEGPVQFANLFIHEAD